MKPRFIKPPVGGAVYILPNMLTTGNLFFGFFSIVKAMSGNYTWAAGAILLSAIFDILDGRVARLTRGTSEFGVQYDSLCDLVSFGLAPAFLMYQYSLNSLDRIGWILCFIFVACGALRLARFNVQSSIGKASGDFTGLPIPMAAGVIACLITCLEDLAEFQTSDSGFLRTMYEISSSSFIRNSVFAVLAPTLALLMVSNVAYRSHKSINIKFIKPFRLLALLVVLIGLIAYNPPLGGFLFFFSYALSGLFEWCVGWKKPRDDDEIFEPLDDASSTMEPSSEDRERQ